MKNTNLEIMNLLKEFQEGYIKRDLTLVDEYLEKFFDKEDNIVIIGTGLGEWCLGYEGAREIVAGDWEYWGDFRMKLEEAEIREYGKVAFVNTKGTLKYTFKHEPETYTRYLDSAKANIADESRTSKAKLTETNFVLSHFLHQRDKLENQYLWNINVTFTLVKREEKWYIRQMQFSMPVDGHYPDARIVGENFYYESYNEEVECIKKYKSNNTCTETETVKTFVEEFMKDLSNEKFFNETAMCINTDQESFKGVNEIKEIMKWYEENFDAIKLNSDNMLLNSQDEMIWIAADGKLEKKISEEELFDRAKATIDKICEKQLDDKEKLFRIRRTIADAMKESANGEDFIWPFRFEALLCNKDGKLSFEYLQFSYPFDMILEGKTDAISDNNLK